MCILAPRELSVFRSMVWKNSYFILKLQEVPVEVEWRWEISLLVHLMLSMWNRGLNSDRFLPFIKYWYKLSSQKPLQPHIPHPKTIQKLLNTTSLWNFFFFLLWDDEPFMASISEFQITKSVSLITWGGRGNRCHLLRSRPSAASHLPLQYYHIIKCDA